MYVHPIETAMVQQQLVPTGKQIPPLPSMLGKMVRTEGISGWYRGITASLLREMVYSSLRFGLYEPFRDAFAKIGPVSTVVLTHIMGITVFFRQIRVHIVLFLESQLVLLQVVWQQQ